MDDIRIIVEIVGHVAHPAKIVQPHIGKFGEAPADMGCQIIDDLQCRGRGIPHRHPLQDRVGREIDVEIDAGMARDQADGVTLEIPDHGIAIVSLRKAGATRGISDVVNAAVAFVAL